jgi:hypothetical protein
VARYGWCRAKDSAAHWLTIDPEREGHNGWWIIYSDSTHEQGHPGAFSSTDDSEVAKWLADRLNIAEAHAPWPHPIPSRIRPYKP